MWHLKTPNVRVGGRGIDGFSSDTPILAFNDVMPRRSSSALETMCPAFRAVAVIIATVLCVPPILWASLASIRVLTGSIAESGAPWLWPRACWWLGLLGAIHLCLIAKHGRATLRELPWPMGLLAVGVYGALRFHAFSLRDPSWTMSLGSLLIPYASMVALGVMLRMISTTRLSGPHPE